MEKRIYRNEWRIEKRKWKMEWKLGLPSVYVYELPLEVTSSQFLASGSNRSEIGSIAYWWLVGTSEMDSYSSPKSS